MCSIQGPLYIKPEFLGALSLAPKEQITHRKKIPRCNLPDNIQVSYLCPWIPSHCEQHSV